MDPVQIVYSSFQMAAMETLSSSDYASFCKLWENYRYVKVPNTDASNEAYSERLLSLFMPYSDLLPVVAGMISTTPDSNLFFRLMAAKYKLLARLEPYPIGGQNTVRRPARYYKKLFYAALAISALECQKMSREDFTTYLEMWEEFVSSRCSRPGKFEIKLWRVAEKYHFMRFGYNAFRETMRDTLPFVYYVEDHQCTIEST